MANEQIPNPPRPARPQQPPRPAQNVARAAQPAAPAQPVNPIAPAAASMAAQIAAKKSENARKTPTTPIPPARTPTTRETIQPNELEVSEATERAYTEGNEDVGHTLTEAGAVIKSTKEKGKKEDEEQARQPSGVARAIKSVSILAGILVFVLLFFNFAVKTYKVDGSSMFSTLDDGDRLLVNALGKTWANIAGGDYIPKRADVVILDNPDGDGTQLIKRVIGLPGERVVIRDSKYVVYNDEFPDGFDPDTTFEADLEPTTLTTDVVVPEGHVFVSGDNRTSGGSYDSRSFGPVDNELLQGSAFFKFLPIGSMKAL